MKIENNPNANEMYLTSDDVEYGTCFRYIGSDEVFFKSVDDVYKLSNGEPDYSRNDNEAVEIVLGHFVVDGIISSRQEYEKCNKENT